MLMPVEFLRVAVDHGDWAVFTEGSSVRVNVASSVPLLNGIKRSMLIINASSIRDVKQLISRIRDFRGVKLIDVLGRYSVRNKAITLVSTVRVFKGGVLEVLLSNNVYYYHEFITNGLEYWSIVISRGSVLLDELRSRGSVKLIDRVSVSDLTESIGYSTLTEGELRILKTAYEMGYFNWPKECSISELANALGVSKVTLIQELRGALRKLAAGELFRVKLG